MHSETIATDYGKNGQDKDVYDYLYERSGYTFKEWNTKADGTGTSYTDEQTINRSSNIALYAIWEKIGDVTDPCIEIKDDIIIYRNNSFEKLATKLSRIFDIKETTHYDKNGNETEEDLTKTGDVIRIKTNDNSEEQYQIVVLGDETGTGKVTTKDLLHMKKYFVGNEILIFVLQ